MATGRIGTTPVLQVRWSKAPSAGTTSLSGLDDNSVSLVYSVGYEAVYRNGVLLSRTNDYTATNGTTVTLIDATIAGDIIEIFATQTVPLTDTFSQTVADGRFIKNTLTTTTGDIIYASAANTPARLAIGSTSQVLTVSGGIPAWGAASSGALTLISTATFTTAASQSLNSVFTSTYTNYRIMFAVNAPTNDGNANFFLRASGTDFAGTQTVWSYAGYEDAGTLIKAGANTTGAFWTLFQLDGGTTADRYFCSMDISRPQEAKDTTATWLAQYVNSSNTWYANNQGGGLQYTSNQYDGFTLKASAGTISGKIWVYGYSN